MISLMFGTANCLPHMGNILAREYCSTFGQLRDPINTPQIARYSYVLRGGPAPTETRRICKLVMFMGSTALPAATPVGIGKHSGNSTAKAQL
jgi:hypothetical protein